jgi:hypothetical protein
LKARVALGRIGAGQHQPMKLNAADLGTPRRMFLAVLVVLALVLAWELSKPWRTGIDEHRINQRSMMSVMFGGRIIHFGTNRLLWTSYSSYDRNGIGFLYLDYPTPSWQFTACVRTNLMAVTPQDARGQFITTDEAALKMFGADWQTNGLVIRDGQILLLRHSTATQTVYALEVVKQSDYTGHLRSRKILPAPESR